MLHAVRRFVREHGRDLGASRSATADLVIAVNEVATNAFRHGGGQGTLTIWDDNGSLLCDIADEGRLDAPLAGRDQPSSFQTSGWGLWLANQLCDLVQLRTFPTGTVVRLHMSLR
jgi:anti-sigma regulatory factor (Ser/Thr protein kinase)